jgi:DDE superfamily endonuclease
MRRIMTWEAYQKGRTTQATQDGNREFITLIGSVSALGYKIPPTLLYKGASKDLQDSWVNDLKEEDDVFFGSTPNGWTNDAYGMKWLTEVFEPRTRPNRPTSKRLLIVDGHSSHVNMRFIEWADLHGIMILILPPHSTHRLQPLDVNCFQPLSTAYSVHLDKWVHKSQGRVSMSKRDFYGIFRSAWLESFNESNIQGAYAKTGIWPLLPHIVLDTIAPPPETPPRPQIEPLKPPPTPMTSKSIRRAQKAYKSDPSKANLDLILRSQERLAAQHEIDVHIQEGLIETLKKEKERRKRGKKLNLVGEEEFGAQLFHSSRVCEALAYEAEKETAAAAIKADKEAKKAQVQENKARKVAEAQERAVQRQVDKEIKAQKAAEKLAEKEAQKSQSQLPKKNGKKAVSIVPLPKKTSDNSAKAGESIGKIVAVVEEEESESAQTRTRKIHLPVRFKN